MSTWLAGAAIIVGAAVASVAGLAVARRVLSRERFEAHHDVAAAMYALVGTIYAVLLAFAVVVVWQAFTDTQATVSHEANALADLERMSRGFPLVIRREAHEAASTYAHVVITREWPAMANGGSSPQANAALIELWHIYTDVPSSVKSSPLYSSSLTQLNAVSDGRRTRLLSSESRIPLMMWALLITGGVLMVVFSYFFVVRSFAQQAAMTAMVAGMIAFGLFLIFSLNGPFAGAVKVQPTAFETTLSNMEHVEP